MLTNHLFDEVMLKPIQLGADTLHIVSGYATPTMAVQHLDALHEVRPTSIELSLVVGMTPLDGIYAPHHAGFQELSGSPQDKYGRFSCSYIMRGKPPVHAKVYVWSRGHQPVVAYTGSANYTRTAFFGRQREVLVECDPIAAKNYYDALAAADTVWCTHSEVGDHVVIETDRRIRVVEDTESDPPANEQRITCSLLQQNGEMHTAAGLNWGQRAHRNPNQAYIPVPVAARHSKFFPPRGTPFTIQTDDGRALIAVIAQDDGKAIETPTNNSLLGEYFRGRLGVANGAFVKKEDLERYGRTSVTFSKIDDDDETYFMDFSVPPRY